MAKGISSVNTGVSSMRELLIAIGGDVRSNENRTSWLHRIAATAGLHYRVVRAVWHGESISRETARVLKLAAKQHENFRENAAARFENYAEILRKVDPEFYREAADTYLAVARRIRNLDGGEE